MEEANIYVDKHVMSFYSQVFGVHHRIKFIEQLSSTILFFFKLSPIYWGPKKNFHIMSPQKGEKISSTQFFKIY